MSWDKKRLLIIASSMLLVIVAIVAGLIAVISANQMEESPFSICDLNYDGACDEEDEHIFDLSLGKCREDPEYNIAADVNGDGCIDAGDQYDFLQQMNLENEAP